MEGGGRGVEEEEGMSKLGGRRKEKDDVVREKVQAGKKKILKIGRRREDIRKEEREE